MAVLPFVVNGFIIISAPSLPGEVRNREGEERTDSKSAPNRSGSTSFDASIYLRKIIFAAVH